MDNHEAIVQEYLKMALPRCADAPQPVVDKYGNILPPELQEFSLKSGRQKLAYRVWNFVDPEGRDNTLWFWRDNRDGYVSEMTNPFAAYVDKLMLFSGRTFEDAVAEATEIVREAVRRYYDGTIADWAKSLFTEEESLQEYEVLKRYYARLEGRDSGQDQGRDLPGGGS